MGVIIPTGECQVTHNYSNTGSTHISSFTYGVRQVIGTGLDAADVAEITHNFWHDEDCPGEQAFLIPGWRFESTRVTKMLSGGPQVAEFVDPVGSGYTGQEAMTPNAAILIRKTTSAGGRRNRGRMYLPPGVYIPRAEVTVSGRINDTQKGFLQNALDFWADKLISGDLEAVLHHSDGASGTPIVRFLAESQIATQRRRVR